MLPQRAEALVEIGVDDMTISIDGPPEIHDEIRGRKGSFARLYEGIEKLNAEKARTGKSTPLVRISATINDLNCLHIRDLPGSRRAASPRPHQLRPPQLYHAEMAEGAQCDLLRRICTLARSCMGDMDLHRHRPGAAERGNRRGQGIRRAQTGI